jgi:hypothetical protein
LVIFRGGHCGFFGGMVLGVRVPPVLGGYIICSQLALVLLKSCTEMAEVGLHRVR